jgi:hypothetical protein
MASLTSPFFFFFFSEIIGVGYKASINPQGSILYLRLGFSHEIQLRVFLMGRGAW